MDKIAIYDMDRTVTRIGTFTPFLVFVAKRRPLRMLLLPVYLLSLLGYPLKLLDRKRLKEIGFGLIVGRRVAAVRLEALARDYSRHVEQRNCFARARERIAADRAEGCRLVMATASPDFYVNEIAALLGFDAVIATRQARHGDGDYSNRIDGENCYGPEKLVRIQQWLGADGEEHEIRFYSDHHSDAPVLEWADRAIATNPNPRLQAMAAARHWEVVRFS
jgi:HAD superfamily hydrolase (TIGR01490 family)